MTKKVLGSGSRKNHSVRYRYPQHGTDRTYVIPKGTLRIQIGSGFHWVSRSRSEAGFEILIRIWIRGRGKWPTKIKCLEELNALCGGGRRLALEIWSLTWWAKKKFKKHHAILWKIFRIYLLLWVGIVLMRIRSLLSILMLIRIWIQPQLLNMSKNQNFFLQCQYLSRQRHRCHNFQYSGTLSLSISGNLVTFTKKFTKERSTRI